MPVAALPRSTPTAQGVASAGVLALLDALDEAPDVELHSVMLLRHGHVVAEGWWHPYRPEQPHLLYSLSKSVTATAAGLAAAEGLLSFDDLVVDHVPELADAAVSPWSRTMQVRHLAAMATGHREDTWDRMRQQDRAEPVRAFLSIAPDAEPGSLFAYNNGATYVLGALVQRVTGEPLSRYLQPRLFDPLGISPPFWHAHPPERELGFSGLHLRTEDLARFGQLYLDDGVVAGTRLLPEGWVADATALHTPNPAEPNPDWQQGYGYQFWRSRHGYRGDGAYGQFCLVLPEQDAVLVTTAQTENMQAVLDAVWAHLLPALGAAPTHGQDDELADRLAAAALPTTGAGLVGTTSPDAVAAFVVREVVDEPAGGWRVTLADGRQEVTFGCGDGAWSATTCTLEDGRVQALAATGTATADRLVVELAFVQTPHRLVLEVDRATLESRGRWLSVPLHPATFAGLAVRPATDTTSAGDVSASAAGETVPERPEDVLPWSRQPSDTDEEHP